MKDKVVYQLKDKAIWVVLAVLVVAFTIANPRFVNPNNLFSLLRQVSMFGIASIGMEINAIKDITPVPHNGCRPPKRRRV